MGMFDKLGLNCGSIFPKPAAPVIVTRPFQRRLVIGVICAIGSLMNGNSSIAQTFSGQFNNQTAYPWPAAHPDRTKVFSGDFNGDGYGDVGLGHPNNGSHLYIKYGDGTGQFRDHTQTSFSWPALGSGSGQPFSVDINGDGYSDIGLYNPNGLGNFYFRYGDGAGNFKVQTSYPWKAAKPKNTKVFSGDFNGDGWGDIGLYNPNGGYAFYIRYGNGSGVHFNENPQTSYTWATANIKETQIISGDFDGNGYGDISLFNPNNGGAFYIQYGNGAGAFSTEKRQTAYTWVAAGTAFSADYNGDGYWDIGLYNPNGQGNFYIKYAVPTVVHQTDACTSLAGSNWQSIDRRVTACTGTWSAPGIRTVATAQQPSVAENLCGPGYRVCKKDRVTTCVGISNKAPGFFAADQSSNGGAICTSTGANDLFGCGHAGNKPAKKCSPLNKTSGDLCRAIAGQGWSCGTDGAAEFDNVTKTAGAGGVLCCPIENGGIAWESPQSGVYQISSDMSGKLEVRPNMAVETAQAYADSRDVISSFYLVGDDYTGSDLKPGDAVFFAGTPKTKSTTGVSLHEKHISSVARHALKYLHAYYSFDVNANDNSNSGNNGTQNFATLYQDGYRGNAIRFPAGTNAQVTFPPYNNSSLSKFSISLWVKATAGMKVGATNGKASILGPLYFDINSNKIKYELTASNGSNVVSLTSATAINIGQWTHVNVTKDDLYVTLFINGHVAARENNITDIANPFGSTIGGIPATSSPPYASFVGAVDEVFLFTDSFTIEDINIFAGKRKSERGIRNDRGFSTQSSRNDGQPGYKAKAVCRSSPWGFCLEYAYECSGNQLIRDRICKCSAGTDAKSPAGTGCMATTTPPPPPAKMTINNLSVGYENISKKWIPKEVLVSNASRAFFQGTGNSAVTNKKLIERFSAVPTTIKKPKKIITAMCKQEKDRHNNGDPYSPFVTTSFLTACHMIENKMEASYRCRGDKTNDLNISMKLPPLYTEEVQMNFPKLNVQEWGNLFRDHNSGAKDFIVVNTNFWEMTDTPPCGTPLGYYRGDGATESTNQTGVYDSLAIRVDETSRENTFHFYRNGNIPVPEPVNSHVIASGVLLRHNGTDIPTTQATPTNAKADQKVGRTALGYSSADDELKIIVIPKYTADNRLMKTASETLAMFDKKYDNVILFDGGGSATFAYWKAGEQIFKIGDPQKSSYQAGLNLRSIPVALIIAPSY